MSLVELFCDVDDFCQAISSWSDRQLLGSAPKRGRKPKLSASEVIWKFEGFNAMLNFFISQNIARDTQSILFRQGTKYSIKCLNGTFREGY